MPFIVATAWKSRFLTVSIRTKVADVVLSGGGLLQAQHTNVMHPYSLKRGQSYHGGLGITQLETMTSTSSPFVAENPDAEESDVGDPDAVA